MALTELRLVHAEDKLLPASACRGQVGTGEGVQRVGFAEGGREKQAVDPELAPRGRLGGSGKSQPDFEVLTDLAWTSLAQASESLRRTGLERRDQDSASLACVGSVVLGPVAKKQRCNLMTRVVHACLPETMPA